ncbi:MAG: 1-deoxy-D-xylulose-5-phosphate reductoisomerase, partial [Lachnospiraceae bacterium]
VSLFLDRKIRYLEITEIIDTAMQTIPFVENPTVDQILEIEKMTYELIESRW